MVPVSSFFPLSQNEPQQAARDISAALQATVPSSEVRVTAPHLLTQNPVNVFQVDSGLPHGRVGTQAPVTL